MARETKLEVSFGRYKCDCVDSRSVSLDVKVLFSSVSAPAFSYRTKVL